MNIKKAKELLNKPLDFKPEDAPDNEEVIAALQYKIIKALAELEQPEPTEFTNMIQEAFAEMPECDCKERLYEACDIIKRQVARTETLERLLRDI